MDLCRWYGISPLEIESYTPYRLSIMLSAMLKNRAAERIRNVEEMSYTYMKEKAQKKFLDGLFKEMDDKYKDPHQVDEEELKRILGNGIR